MMVYSLTLPPWPGDPYARTNRILAFRYDHASRYGILSPALFIGLPAVGRYCTRDRTPGLFLRWVRVPLPFLPWRAAYRTRAIGGLLFHNACTRLYSPRRRKGA